MNLPRGQKHNFLLAVCWSLALHIGVASVLMRMDGPSPASEQGTTALQLAVHLLPESQEKPSPPHQIDVVSAPTTTSNSSNIPNPAWPKHTHPRLTWVNELELETLDEYNGSGFVELEIMVDPEGNAAKVTTVNTNLPRMFEDLAIENFELAHFEPGTLNGSPVTDKLRIQIHFR